MISIFIYITAIFSIVIFYNIIQLGDPFFLVLDFFILGTYIIWSLYEETP